MSSLSQLSYHVSRVKTNDSCLSVIGLLIRSQSRIQNPQVLWPAVSRKQRLWGTGILLPQDFCGKTMQALRSSQ